MKIHYSRRRFICNTAAGSLAAGLALRSAAEVHSAPAKPAALGGSPVRTKEWPSWPSWRREWEPRILEIMRSGRWWRGRGEHVSDFEAAYADLLGAKRCLATASGTTALLIALHVLDVDAGDEVVVSPFTFIATYNAILIGRSLPVFADTDPETLTLDPSTIESRITDRTRAVMPVHIYGLPCDMDPINAIAKKHGLPVIEDACQAWLAEYRGKKCGVLADLGCFSFQNSKHLPSGEGGAITGNDESLLDRCHSFHNCGRAYQSFTGEHPYFTRGSNRRMQQVQAAMLIQQLGKLQTETAKRQANASYLSKKLADQLGIQPVRLAADSSPAWHLYPMRYDNKAFHGLSRDRFIEAMRAEGIPLSRVYHEQYFDGLLDEAIESRGYKRLFSARRLKEYKESLHHLPGNKQVCETTVAFTQNLLLAEQPDMDDILNAIEKVRAHSGELARGD